MARFSLTRLRALWRLLSPLDVAAIVVAALYVLSRLIESAGVFFPLYRLIGYLFVLSIVYAIFRVTPWVRNKALWSLRNRLIVAYIFIAVVPVVLLITMGSIASYLIYMQFGAHILRDDIQTNISMLQAATRAVRASVDEEATRDNTGDPGILLGRPDVIAVIADESKDLPGLRVDAERSSDLVDKWGGEGSSKFSGMVQSDDQLWFRCTTFVHSRQAAFPLSLSVPVTSSTLDSFGSELGPINLTILRPADSSPSRGLRVSIDGREYVPAAEVTSRSRVVPPRERWFDAEVTGGLTWEAVLVDPRYGEAKSIPVLAAFSVRASRLNGRLFATLGALGPLLTLTLVITTIVFVILEAAALATGVVLTRRITIAVADLYEATAFVRRGDFSHRVRVQKRDQLGILGESFNDMTASIGELIEEQRKRQRLENEISIAREVQGQLFPQSIPEMPGVELAAICRAARTVSGDYYDFIRLSPTRIGIAVADISGKGISAALLMASLQAALRSQALLDPNCGTAELVTRLNRHLFHNTSDDRYATFFYAIVDTSTRTLEYTNAGHCAPIFIADGKVSLLDVGGTVVGLFDEVSYESAKIEVPPDSLLITFSDGLTEPENVYGEEFGTQRLGAEALRHRDASPQRIAESLIDAAEQWAGTPEQADDMTVVVARLFATAAPRTS